MDEMKNLDSSAFVNDDTVYNKQIKSIPKPEVNIGIDKNNDVTKEIVDSVSDGIAGTIDMSKIQSFTNLSRDRARMYETLDMMAEDPIISAALETYVEDATEPNERGEIFWAESDDEDTAKFTNFLLQSINVDKYAVSWVSSLCLYGDLYLRLFRESDVKDILFGDNGVNTNDRSTLNEAYEELKKCVDEETDEEKKKLKEDVIVKLYKPNDKYTHYVEKVADPSGMFELTRFGKTCGYISAPVPTSAQKHDNLSFMTYRYSFQRSDVEVFGATEFVHACLDSGESRVPEEINIFMTQDDYEAKRNGLTYKVKRGQSLLYTVFKAWREVTLLQNALLLNRLTKSAVTKVVQMEVGAMPKEDTQKKLYYLKSLLEQKTAINQDLSISNYTNPGPMENIIYMPKRNGQGAIDVQTIGGDTNVESGGIADIDYFNNRLFGALRIPKQFLGFTDDAAGFSGGQSLSIISSRYAKAVKRIQNAMIIAVTDLINLMLLDKGLSKYIGKFTIKMQPPITQAEVDRKDIMQGTIANISDVMNLLTDIESVPARLKILKSLISPAINDGEVLSIIQQEIDKLEEVEKGQQQQEVDPNTDEPISHGGGGFDFDSDLGGDLDLGDDNLGGEDLGTADTGSESAGSEDLPTPAEAAADIDFTEMGGEE